jgi:hypothetical protein
MQLQPTCVIPALADVVDASIKLIAFLSKRMTATTALVVLLKDEHLLSRACQDGRRGQTTNTGTDHDGVKFVSSHGQLSLRITVLEHGIAFGFVRFILLCWLA